MASALLDALLRSCRDPAAALDALCWGSDCFPDKDTVDALTCLITRLGDVSDRQPGAAPGPELLRRAEAIVWDRCFPLLCATGRDSGPCEPDGPGRRRALVAALCRLLGACAGLCGGAVPERLVETALPVLLAVGEEDVVEPGGDTCLDPSVAVEVIAAALPHLCPRSQLTHRLLDAVLACARAARDALVSKVVSRVLFSLLNNNQLKPSELLRRLWEGLKLWDQEDSSPAATARLLLCLTALSDQLLRASAAPSVPPVPQHPDPHVPQHPDPRLCPRFWALVQRGLTHRDNVSRKRALFLLKRCVSLSEETGAALHSGPAAADGVSLFWWEPHRLQLLLGFWVDYMLIMETLDENQIHVVRPVLNRFSKLMEATVADGPDRPLFHPSWLVCVYRRMFDSENKTVMEEGVRHLLELPPSPCLSLGFAEFVVGPFLDVLADSRLFHRAAGQSAGECPELAVKLQGFLVTFIGSLPEDSRGAVVLQMVQGLACRHWCAVPLLFLSQALAQLPPCPALGLPGLHALREVLRSTMVTHQVLLRGAAQCFLLETALHLTDVSAVTLEDVFSFLQHFRADESLCRGTGLWTRLCDWLHTSEGLFRSAGPRRGAEDGSGPLSSYVQNLLDSFLRVPASAEPAGPVPGWAEAELVGRAVLLAADLEQRRAQSGEVGVPESPGLPQLLRPLLDTLHRVGTSVYLPVCKTDRSLQLLLSLLRLCRHQGPQDAVRGALEQCVFSVAEPVQEYVVRRLGGELCTLQDVERCRLYLSVLRALVQLGDAVGRHRVSLLQRLVPALSRSCLRTLEPHEEQSGQPCRTLPLQPPQLAAQVQRAVGQSAAAWLCEVALEQPGQLHPDSCPALAALTAHLSRAPMNQMLAKPLANTEQQGCVEEGPCLQGWGRLAAQFVQDQWSCLRLVVSRSAPPPGVLQGAMEALSILPSDQVLPVLSCLRTLLPQLLVSEASLCVEAVTLAWTVVRGLSSSPHDFWPVLRGFIQLVFQQAVLELPPPEHCQLSAAVARIAVELIEMSQTKAGVFNQLIQQCCDTWMPLDAGSDSAFASALTHLDIFTEACLHGPVLRRDQRLLQDVQAYIEQLGEECAANSAVSSDCRDDHFPRVHAMAFLSRLDASNELHKTFMEQLVLRLLNKDEEAARARVRYYGNSLQHRVKNRAWQSLLLLLPRLEEASAARVLGRLYEAGFCGNQASVKYLIEWQIILTLERHPALLPTLWPCFLLGQENNKTSICTFLSVLVHLGTVLQRVDDKAAQWRRALDVILQWCFSHNFSVRLYALLALKRVWALRGDAGVGPGLDGLGGLAALVESSLEQAEAMQGSGNAMKNWQRIQEHFFFGTFHPLQDYSVETIFHTLPSLSDLADDEWIPVWKFQRLAAFPSNPSLPLHNPRRELREAGAGDWVQQDKGDGERAAEWAEVQKKMTAWWLSEPDPDLELQQHRAARLGKSSSALVVVASLIDKPTNLGGLCRTCEIFGASALVLDSLHHLSDKHFQALSVSAELWLPLLEVKPPQLAVYLEEKRSEGYCIVGVEQTANSCSLADYRFPEKTLLLLGNEREGIPADLLQQLEVCVEIPQRGVTRSLNVHVSAALLVWEYTRQQLTAPPQP
ncbi:probable methyltransferase TARBP1 isoform X2 [Amia ocellicauda]|uniref:probable methyltransferase TARBP1 isoform X2 n=1 Tax=Amia ocellicauda TaxID=2972642 RepID=UPI0034649047